MKVAAPHYLISIGASAGGMEEINSFFDRTPSDNVSYVVVQHLSVAYKSRMVEMLARHSKLMVDEATNAMEVESNHVYLIPNDKFMTISGNRLYLTDKEKDHTVQLTINTFFNSLAGDYGSKAIGIILSGNGSDGTEGVKAIKNAGGMVIVRNPQTTAFAGMPAHAIATGVADLVLEPESMPGAIEDYIKHRVELARDNEDDEKHIIAIIKLIREKLPLDFSEYKKAAILRRKTRRVAYHNISSLKNYYNFLKTTPEEIDTLANEFITSVASFLWDREAFNLIQKKTLKQILENLKHGKKLKIGTGRITGEEVYAIAILIAEQLTGDFTELKLILEQLDKSMGDLKKIREYKTDNEVKLRSMFESLADAYFLFGKDAEIIDFNKAAYDFVKDKYGEGLTCGRSMTDFLMPDYRKTFHAHYRKALGGAYTHLERLGDYGQKGTIWWDCVFEPVRNDNGEIIGVSYVSRNINDRKLNEERILEQNRSLSRVAEIQSHDYRGPVATILGLMALIRGDDYVASKEYLMMLNTAVEQLDEKIHDVVNIVNETRVLVGIK